MAAEDIIWVDGGATELTLMSSGDLTRGVLEIQGLGMPPVRHDVESVPFWDGQRRFDHIFLPRIVRIAFDIADSSRANWYSTRRTLMQRFNPELGQGYLRIVDASATEYRLYCYVRAGPEIPRTGQNPLHHRDVVELIAHWPFFRAASESSQGPGTSLTCNNAGDIPTFPQIVTVNANLTITNTTRSKSIVVSGSPTGGKTLEFGPPYNDVGVVTAVKTSDSSNILGYVTKASDVNDFALARGNNTVTSSSGNITVNWYNYFLGV